MQFLVIHIVVRRNKWLFEFWNKNGQEVVLLKRKFWIQKLVLTCRFLARPWPDFWLFSTLTNHGKLFIVCSHFSLDDVIRSQTHQSVSCLFIRKSQQETLYNITSKAFKLSTEKLIITQSVRTASIRHYLVFHIHWIRARVVLLTNVNLKKEWAVLLAGWQSQEGVQNAESP